MSLLSVIFALIAETLISSLSEVRRFDFIFRYVSWLRAKLPTFSFQTGSVSLVIVVGGVLFSVWLVSAMLANVLSLFGFIFGIVVLVFMIGPRDLDEDIQNSKIDFVQLNVELKHLVESVKELSATIKSVDS